MRSAVLVLACAASIAQSRQALAEDRQGDALATLLFSLNAPVANPRGASRIAAQERLARNRVGHVAMDEEDNKKIVGAAGAGAFLGVFLQQDIVNVALLSLVAAYMATLTNDVGDATRAVGGAADTAYTKAKDINDEYGVLPKAKTAADTVLTVADNVNTNYGLTSKLDEKLAIRAKYDNIKDKFDNIKSKVTDKVDELKSSASSK
jgi:hypothetical protein